METLALISPGDTRKHYMPETRTGVTNEECVDQQLKKNLVQNTVIEIKLVNQMEGEISWRPCGKKKMKRRNRNNVPRERWERRDMKVSHESCDS